MRDYDAALIDWQKARKEGEESQKPPQERLCIEDITMEAAQEVCKHSPEGVLAMQDELSGWIGSMEKYSGSKGGSADRAFWLTAYNGGQKRVDRISRGSFFIENLSISMLGGIQPDPIRKVVADALDDGLIQRFIPIVLAEARPEIDSPNPLINEQYDDLIASLRLLVPQRNGLLRPKPFTFSDEALVVRRALCERHKALEPLRKVNGKLATHIGKYDGLFVRLCLIWHCIENVGKDIPQQVSADTAKRVEAFLHEYILKHAVSFFVDMLGVSEDNIELQKMAGFILAKKLESVTFRDIQRSTGGTNSCTKPQAQVIVERLESLGWLISSNAAKNVWAVNPHAHIKFAEQAQAEAERRGACRKAFAALRR